MNKKYLILISSTFPYRIKEPFLETELKHHAQHFDKIFLFVPKQSQVSPKIKFEIPPGVVIAQFDNTTYLLSKIKGLRFLFSYSFWEELKIIKYNYKLKLTRNMVRSILITYIQADNFNQLLKKFLKSNRIPFNRSTFYTYCCNEFSLGVGMLRKHNKIAGAFSRLQSWDFYFENAPNHYLPLRSKMIRNLDTVFPVSEYVSNFVSMKLPKVNCEKLMVNYLGVEKARDPDYSPKGKTLKILTLTFLNKIKRIDLLVAALEQLKDFQVEWHHIGEGDDYLDIKKYTFNRLFNKENIKYVIHGDFPKSKVYNYLHDERFDVLLNTSSHEGVPVSMMEAMSFSIPVIGTNVGGVSEIIHHEKNGYLLSANPNPQEIIAALTRLYHLSPEAYIDMRKNAYQTWDNKFNADHNYSELIYNMSQFSKKY